MKAKDKTFKSLEPELRIYTIREVAQILKVTPYTTRKYIRNGELESIKQGTKHFVKHEALLKYLKTREPGKTDQED